MQVAAAVAATMGKAKILGFDKKVIEHTGKDGGAIEHNLTLEEFEKVASEVLSKV